MSDIDVIRPHGRTVAEARQIVESLIGKMAKEYDLKHEWVGDTLKFERSGLSGQMAISPSDVHVTAKLGLMLKPLRSTIEKQLVGVLDSKLKLA